MASGQEGNESRVPSQPITVYLALGSNIGDSVAALDQALRYLHASSMVVVQKVSSYLHTMPYGPVQDQPPFVNAVVAVQTWHSPFALLCLCQSIEHAMGRVRTVRWGPRTVDIDIVLYGQQSIATASLTIPHVDMHNRHFVMAPLAELGACIPDEVLSRSAMA